MSTLEKGAKISEGKTKIIYEVSGQRDLCLIHSKDRITAGNAARSDVLEGKAAVSNRTNAKVFEMLQEAGISTHFVRIHSDTEFVAEKCNMIPIEWVTRRVATGSFLKRNVGVSEGLRFSPPKLEMFFKDDANNDPQWSREQLLEARLQPGGLLIGSDEVDIMSRMTVCVFEILEKTWASLNCCLVDMKVEFGVNSKGELVLADIIDSDSWRLWPSGDRRLMKDKQVYRDMKDVTADGLQAVLKNFQWILDRLQELPTSVKARAVVIMGSPADADHCKKITGCLTELGVPSETRVTSAHKGTEETLSVLARYEGDGVPTVFIAVAGRSNGLGPVLSGNTSYPVINCPPLSSDWGAEDIWSSLRLPSGLGCSTVLSPDGASIAAAQMLALSDHRIWSKLRAKQLNTWVALKQADMAACSKTAAANSVQQQKS